MWVPGGMLAENGRRIGHGFTSHYSLGGAQERLIGRVPGSSGISEAGRAVLCRHVRAV